MQITKIRIFVFVISSCKLIRKKWVKLLITDWHVKLFQCETTCMMKNLFRKNFIIYLLYPFKQIVTEKKNSFEILYHSLLSSQKPGVSILTTPHEYWWWFICWHKRNCSSRFVHPVWLCFENITSALYEIFSEYWYLKNYVLVYIILLTITSCDNYIHKAFIKFQMKQRKRTIRNRIKD